MLRLNNQRPLVMPLPTAVFRRSETSAKLKWVSDSLPVGDHDLFTEDQVVKLRNRTLEEAASACSSAKDAEMIRLLKAPDPTGHLRRRTWSYVQEPAHFEMAACICGNYQTHWSEFEDHLWCDECKKDFKPSHNGILNNPIPFAVATLMGVSFDRVNHKSMEIEQFDSKTLTYRTPSRSS
jgi:hypothetical protein